jgi:hypothetical protein
MTARHMLPRYSVTVDYEHVGDGLYTGGDGAGALYDTNDVVADAAPAIVDFIFKQH